MWRRWPARWPGCEGRAVSQRLPGGWKAAAAFILVTLIWGSTWLVIKDQIAAVPPSWTVTWRFALAALGMCALALVRRESLRLPVRVIALAGLIGLFQFTMNFQFVYRAESHVTSGIVAVLFALLIVPNTLLGRLVLGNRIGARFLVGTGIALAGIALLLLREFRVAPAGTDIALGVALAICGILSASAANVLQAMPLAKAQPVVPVIAWAMIIGTLGDAIFAWLVDGPPVLDPRPAYLAGVGYLALVGSVLAFPLYFGLIRNWGPGRAAYNSVAVPVVAMALSTVFEGYRWSLLAAAGAVVALAGLALALSPARSAASPSRNEG